MNIAEAFEITDRPFSDILAIPGQVQRQLDLTNSKETQKGNARCLLGVKHN